MTARFSIRLSVEMVRHRMNLLPAAELLRLALKNDYVSGTFSSMSKPSRSPLIGFPDVLIHAEINSGKSAVKKHPSYAAAKSGDDEAARDLVRETINDQQVEALRRLLDGRKPILVSVHAYESEGVNAIPEEFAEGLADRLGLETDTSIVQTNVVSHTGASGYGRLARPAEFDGEVISRIRLGG